MSKILANFIEEINVDLDGVLFDFDRRVKEICGKLPHEMDDKVMWSVIHQDTNFYARLEPMEDAFELWNYIVEQGMRLGIKPRILTAIPRRTTAPTAEADKREAFARHFCSKTVVNIGPYSRDKQKWAKPGHLLIDDRNSNIHEWKARGGIGILHRTAAGTIGQLKKIGL